VPQKLEPICNRVLSFTEGRWGWKCSCSGFGSRCRSMLPKTGKLSPTSDGGMFISSCNSRTPPAKPVSELPGHLVRGRRFKCRPWLFGAELRTDAITTLHSVLPGGPILILRERLRWAQASVTGNLNLGAMGTWSALKFLRAGACLQPRCRTLRWLLLVLAAVFGVCLGLKCCDGLAEEDSLGTGTAAGIRYTVIWVNSGCTTHG